MSTLALFDRQRSAMPRPCASRAIGRLGAWGQRVWDRLADGCGRQVAREAGVGLLVTWGLSRVWGWQVAGFDLLGVVVALLAAQYGFWAGTGVGLLAAAVRLIEAGQSPALAFQLWGDRAALPEACALVALGVCVGWVGDAHRAARQRSREAAEEARLRLGRLAERYQRLKAAKDDLERRFARHVRPLHAVYRALKALDAPDDRTLVMGTLLLVRRFLGADALAIYGLAGHRLRLLAALGDRPERRVELGLGEGPIGRAARTNASVGLPLDACVGAPVLMAEPVRRPNGACRAVIAIEGLPFERLGPASQAIVALVADWLGEALDSLEARPTSRSDGAEDGLLGVGAALDRLDMEWRLARRHRLPLAFIHVRLPGRVGLARDVATRLAASLSFPLHAAGHAQEPGTYWAILPLCTAGEAAALAESLREGLPGASILYQADLGEASSLGGALNHLQGSPHARVEA